LLFSRVKKEVNMKLTVEQAKAIQNGQAVEVTVGNAACIVLRKDVYERGGKLDYSPWSTEEMDLLAAETADLLAGDGLDEPDDS
jgi:hypothetical protein